METRDLFPCLQPHKLSLTSVCSPQLMYVPSATAQFRPLLFCVWTPTVFKLVLLCLSLISPLHSLLCHQWYLSKHLSVSNHSFASNVWWLPISHGAQSKFCDMSEKVLRHLAAACLFSFFSTTLPCAHLHTSTHTAHTRTHNTHTPEPCTRTYTHPSVFWLHLIIPHLVLEYFPDYFLGLHCLDAFSLFFSHPFATHHCPMLKETTPSKTIK